MTFSIPGVVGAVATATLDNTFLPERVTVKSGTNTTEFVYSNFQDFNNPLFKIEGKDLRVMEGKMGEEAADTPG